MTTSRKPVSRSKRQKLTTRDINKISEIEEFLELDLKLSNTSQQTIDMICRIDDIIRQNLKKHRRLHKERNPLYKKLLYFAYRSNIYKYRSMWARDPIAKRYYRFKANRCLVFDISSNGSLLKISRHLNGPSSSVVYQSESDENDEQIKIVLSGKELGRGGFGKVIAGTVYGEEKKVAVKIRKIPKDDVQKKRKMDEIKKEIDQHIELGREFFTSCLHMPGYKHYLAMERIPGVDGEQIILKTRGHPIELLKILHSMSKEIQSMHNKNYVHRDIKPQNFVCKKVMISGESTFTSEYISKLVDLQWASWVGPDDSITDSEIVGTKDFFDVEAIKDQGKFAVYNRKTDIFAFGVICAYAYSVFLHNYAQQNIAAIDHVIMKFIHDACLHYTRAQTLRPDTLEEFIIKSQNIIANVNREAAVTEPEPASSEPNQRCHPI